MTGVAMGGGGATGGGGGGDGRRRRTAVATDGVEAVASRRGRLIARDLARDLLHGCFVPDLARDLALDLARRRRMLDGKSASAGRPPRGPKPTL